MKTLLNVLHAAVLILLSVALVTGINLRHDPSQLGAHLGWILGALLIWLFSVILSMLYMYRIEKFCVEMADKLEKPDRESPKTP